MPKKRVYNASTGRKYGPGTYDGEYGKKTSRQRSARNKARRKKLASLTKVHGKAKAKAMIKGKDVAHKRSISKGGGNGSSNLRVSSVKANRGRKGEGGRKRGKK